MHRLWKRVLVIAAIAVLAACKQPQASSLLDTSGGASADATLTHCAKEDVKSKCSSQCAAYQTAKNNLDGHLLGVNQTNDNNGKQCRNLQGTWDATKLSCSCASGEQIDMAKGEICRDGRKVAGQGSITDTQDSLTCREQGGTWVSTNPSDQHCDCGANGKQYGSFNIRNFCKNGSPAQNEAKQRACEQSTQSGKPGRWNASNSVGTRCGCSPDGSEEYEYPPAEVCSGGGASGGPTPPPPNPPQADPKERACKSSGGSWDGSRTDFRCTCPNSEPSQPSEEVCPSGAELRGSFGLKGDLPEPPLEQFDEFAIRGFELNETEAGTTDRKAELERTLNAARDAVNQCAPSQSASGQSTSTNLTGAALCTRVGGTNESNGCRCGAAPARWIAYDILEKDPKSCGTEAQNNPDNAVLEKACRDGNGSWNASEKTCRCGTNTFHPAGMFVGGGLDEFVTRCKTDAQRAGSGGTFESICTGAGGTIANSMCRCGMGSSYSEQVIRGDNGNNCRDQNNRSRTDCTTMGATWQGGGRCLCGSAEYPGGENQRCTSGRWVTGGTSPTSGPTVSSPTGPRPPTPSAPPVSNSCTCMKYQQSGRFYCGYVRGTQAVGASRYGPFNDQSMQGWGCAGGANDLCPRLQRPSGC